MTQNEFNQMLLVAIASGLGGSYYTSRWSGEEIDDLLGGKSLVISGVYANLAALQAAFPNGADGAYQVSDTREIYVWNAATQKWESLGLIQGPAGEDGATYTPLVSETGVLSWVNNGGLPNPDPVSIKGPVGPTGATGATGVGIQSISLTGGNGAPGTTDTYTITLTNKSSYTFTVYNGSDGAAIDVESAKKAAEESAANVALTQKSAADALASKTASADSALLSQSWAEGGTGIRADEDTNNSKYWAGVAQAEADRATVPPVENVYNLIIPDRVTGQKYALLVEDGKLAILGVADTFTDTQYTIIDSVTGLAYVVVADNGRIAIEEV